MNINTKIPWYISVTVIISCLTMVYFVGWGPSSQYYGLKQANQWRERISSSFKILQSKYPELENVNIGTYTGGGGTISISIRNELNPEAEIQLYRFILESNPPRPIRLSRIKK